MEKGQQRAGRQRWAATRAGPRGVAGLGASRLTRLHCPLDDAQDVGGVSQLQPVVNSHFHFTRGGVKDMIRI